MKTLDERLEDCKRTIDFYADYKDMTPIAQISIDRVIELLNRLKWLKQNSQIELKKQ